MKGLEISRTGEVIKQGMRFLSSYLPAEKWCPDSQGIEELNSEEVIDRLIEWIRMERGGSSSSRPRGMNMIPLLALHAVREYYNLENKPPVTAGLLAANTLIYLRPGFLDRILPTIDQVWFNPNLILKQRDLKRMVLSAFYHVGEPHLVYNMMSLLWKGIQLETTNGSFEFASMVSALLIMSQGITLILAKSLLIFFDYERAYYHEYAVGFSGVLFGMKVVLNSQSNSYSNVYGLLVPARYAAWAELFLIQLLVPGVSFLGHLGGILAGIVYVHLKSWRSGSDRLSRSIRGFTSFLSWPVRFVQRFHRSRRQRISGRGLVGGSRRTRMPTPSSWRCESCTFDNSGWLSLCEMCGTGRNDDGLGLASHELPLEELRYRRVERFER